MRERLSWLTSLGSNSEGAGRTDTARSVGAGGQVPIGHTCVRVPIGESADNLRDYSRGGPDDQTVADGLSLRLSAAIEAIAQGSGGSGSAFSRRVSHLLGSPKTESILAASKMIAAPSPRPYL
jgi:hypothetical protein